GLLLSHKQHSFLSSSSRIKGYNVWQSLVFVLNGLVFTMIGLALPSITAGLEGVSIYSAIGYGALVTLVLIIGRILAAYGAVIVTMIARNFISVADAHNPGFRGPLILGWAGMRGVVSLAAALSIPVHLQDGTPFPQRNLILFITFIVILLTLVIQGLTLPFLIRKLNLIHPDHSRNEQAQYHSVRQEMAQFALQHLKDNYGETLNQQPVLQRIAHKWEDHQLLNEDANMTMECKAIYISVLEQQRKWLIQKNKEESKLDETIIRKLLHHVDMEEEKIRFL
ncbi:cation:proton antiporter, partial [Flavobacterium nitrogenifigens]|uniref:cation:proton antiporter domain-containing protein n=1 Tax=Flavobacterium nitrogenifigens TaxID=1617283 RepID=UPI0031AEFFD9